MNFLWKLAIPALMLQSIIYPGIAHAGPDPATGYRKFVIYYGWYAGSDDKIGEELDKIIKSQPEFVISPFYTSSGKANLTPEVVQKFHAGGIGVIAYIATGNAHRDLDEVLEEMKTGFDNGSDGIMLDEVASLHSQWQVDYYKKIYDYAKTFGDDKIVIANPGTVLVNEKVMQISDILSFEHQWRLAQSIDWFSKYPADRFMGISSNDVNHVMGYTVDEEMALQDTVEAWQTGIGYHYSTDVYTKLPRWYDDYQDALKEFNPASTELHEVKVKTVDSKTNDEIEGLWIEVRKAGNVVGTGFSPAKFILTPGMYQISAANYQNFIFSHWGDGVASTSRFVKVGNDTELTAVYKNELASLTVQALDQLDRSISGISVSVGKDNRTVAEGQTPLHLSLPVGTYSVSTSDHQYYEFMHWEDGVEGTSRVVVLSQDIVIQANYNNMLANSVNAGCLGTQDYQRNVTSALIKGGPLAGLLEIYKQKSIMTALCG